MNRAFIACPLAIAIGLAGSAAQAASTLLSGFEPNLAGWQTIGDVTAQTAAIGLTPTQGLSSAFVTTLGAIEHPYGPTPSPNDALARQFLGLPGDNSQFMRAMPTVTYPFDAPPVVGEGGAMKLRFYATEAGTVSFDWNRIGRDGDSAFVSLWSDDNSFRVNDWIYFSTAYTGGFQASGVDLCSRQQFPSDCSEISNRQFYNSETGWHNKSLTVTQAGWYTIGFGVGEVAEGTAPTVLALDNLVFTSAVPESSTAALLAAGLAVVGTRLRRRPAARP